MPDIPGDEGRQKQKGRQRMRWLDDITNSKDRNWSKLQERVEDRGACNMGLQSIGHD